MKNSTFLSLLVCVFSTVLNAQTGCTDPLAENYNPLALINDGSCTYVASSVSPTSSYELSPILVGTSGLIDWNGSLYIHNDNTDTNIYEISKTDGALLSTIPLSALVNTDWEEISQDENFIYIGDFGNNGSGNRTDLKIQKILKSSLLTMPQIETINFSYSDQTDFSAQSPNRTDFDCESMIVASDGIYLFTKQWLTRKTTLYKLPNESGSQVAHPITTMDVSGLVTGAAFKEDLGLIVLCGYKEDLSPFVYLIYDFKGTDFTISNQRRINVSLPFHQVEGIATSDGLEYFLTNEDFESLPQVDNPQKMHKISLNSYLENYFSRLSIPDRIARSSKAVLYPNPTDGEIKISLQNEINSEYKLFDATGKLLKSGSLTIDSLDLNGFSKGMYVLVFPKSKSTYKIFKK